MYSYTQINIGGRLRGFEWGKYASGLYVQKLNKEDHEFINNVFEIEDLSAVLFAGLSMSCYRLNQHPDFTFEDVIEWAEGLSDVTQIKIGQSILNSAYFRGYQKRERSKKVKASTVKKWYELREKEIKFALEELNISLFEYNLLTDWEFYSKAKGYYERQAFKQADSRLIAYPLYFQYSEKTPPKISEWWPIPIVDKKAKKSAIDKEWTPAQIKKIFGQYYPEDKKVKKEVQELKNLAQQASQYDATGNKKESEVNDGR